MEKIDFKKTLSAFYKPSSKKFTLIDMPKQAFLMVDGSGNPNTAPAYIEAIEALYPMAYTLKFMSKSDLGRDYVVPPLEGLWWADDMDAFASGDKDKWQWTMMIMLPDWISADMTIQARAQVKTKKNPPALGKVRIETLSEGQCVQILHIGSYDDEGPILYKMHHEFMPENSLKPRGKHHEIYLSDPRRTAPEKLKTILRQPVIPTR